MRRAAKRSGITRRGLRPALRRWDQFTSGLFDGRRLRFRRDTRFGSQRLEVPLVRWRSIHVSPWERSPKSAAVTWTGGKKPGNAEEEPTTIGIRAIWAGTNPTVSPTSADEQALAAKRRERAFTYVRRQNVQIWPHRKFIKTCIPEQEFFVVPIQRHVGVTKGMRPNDSRCSKRRGQ